MLGHLYLCPSMKYQRSKLYKAVQIYFQLIFEWNTYMLSEEAKHEENMKENNDVGLCMNIPTKL